MIQCDQLKLSYLPIERTGSQSIETLLRSLDSTTHHTGNHRHGLDTVPDGYAFMVSTRDPAERLASYFTRGKRDVEEFGFGKYYSTFKEYVRWLVATKEMPFLDDIAGALFSPRCKLINGRLVTQPRQQTFYLSQAPTPDYTIRHATFEADVRRLPFVSAETVVPHVDDTAWDWDSLAFDGLATLVAQWEQV